MAPSVDRVGMCFSGFVLKEDDIFTSACCCSGLKE